jgi:hypothetical protein
LEAASFVAAGGRKAEARARAAEEGGWACWEAEAEDPGGGEEMAEGKDKCGNGRRRQCGVDGCEGRKGSQCQRATMDAFETLGRHEW